MKIIHTQIQELNPINTIAVSHRGEYSGIAGAFDKLVRWADANNLWSAKPKMAGVYHDDPRNTPVEQLRSDACLENTSGLEPAEGMHPYTLSGGRYFVMQVELTMAEYSQAWEKAYAVFNENGYGFAPGDHYELYITCCNPQDAGATSIVELCIPMK